MAGRTIENSTSAWQFGCELVSLKDVDIYYANNLASIGGNLTCCMLTAVKEELTQEDINEFKRRLLNMAKEADGIFLPLTAIAARRFASEIETLPHDQLMDPIGELENRYYDEIKIVKFLIVKPERFKFYENTELAGEEFKAKFPKGNTELIEAGNCLALDRYTACAFHLMRALEIALKSLESALGIVRPTQGPDKTWGRTLRRIKDKIAQNDAAPPPNWSTDREFYDKAHAFLMAVKTPLRDDTMHVEATYDEQGAVDVFNVSIVALRFLATNLSE